MAGTPNVINSASIYNRPPKKRQRAADVVRVDAALDDMTVIGDLTACAWVRVGTVGIPIAMRALQKARQRLVRS